MEDESVPVLRLKCPYGRSGEPSGDWSRDCPNWSELVSSNERDRLLGRDRLPDGEFYMALTEFVRCFSAVECVHLDAETSRDEPTLQGKGLLITSSILLLTLRKKKQFPSLERNRLTW